MDVVQFCCPSLEEKYLKVSILTITMEERSSCLVSHTNIQSQES